MSRTLYHYTAEPFVAPIVERGLVEPRPQPVLGGQPLAWFTDLAVPDADALGLTSNFIPYDRTEYRFRVVDAAGCVPWSRLRRTITAEQRALLERSRQPRRWWVARRPVPVVLDLIEAHA